MINWTERCDGYQSRTLIGSYFVRQRIDDWFAEYFSSTDGWHVLCYGTENECKTNCQTHYEDIIYCESQKLNPEVKNRWEQR